MALGFAQKKTNFLVLQNRLFCVDGSLPTCLPLRLQGGAADLLSTKVNFVDFAGVGDVFEGVGVQDDEVGIFPAFSGGAWKPPIGNVSLHHAFSLTTPASPSTVMAC